MNTPETAPLTVLLPLLLVGAVAGVALVFVFYDGPSGFLVQLAGAVGGALAIWTYLSYRYRTRRTRRNSG
ncbi:hypothetical protein ACFO0N_14190 [Halobium salinum]|uniref:Uncharacterized protein n=1 Tax=Halobium salinum TaxID=1364940 RepID=A0ABD5PEM1_9EURY|nr:hypothetical protein [Halobium salinum]